MCLCLFWNAHVHNIVVCMHMCIVILHPLFTVCMHMCIVILHSLTVCLRYWLLGLLSVFFSTCQLYISNGKKSEKKLKKVTFVLKPRDEGSSKMPDADADT
ncbi:hypothetical protein HanRHA438_Chr14g0656771 [Helianthus annuus]|nr:hypothetical protein HanRHA438_Chr14g0656771 [Helianthus annuus]